jgi:hypothetical protein
MKVFVIKGNFVYDNFDTVTFNFLYIPYATKLAVLHVFFRSLLGVFAKHFESIIYGALKNIADVSIIYKRLLTLTT